MNVCLAGSGFEYEMHHAGEVLVVMTAFPGPHKKELYEKLATLNGPDPGLLPVKGTWLGNLDSDYLFQAKYKRRQGSLSIHQTRSDR